MSDEKQPEGFDLTPFINGFKIAKVDDINSPDRLDDWIAGLKPTEEITFAGVWNGSNPIRFVCPLCAMTFTPDFSDTAPAVSVSIGDEHLGQICDACAVQYLIE